MHIVPASQLYGRSFNSATLQKFKSSANFLLETAYSVQGGKSRKWKWVSR